MNEPTHCEICGERLTDRCYDTASCSKECARTALLLAQIGHLARAILAASKSIVDQLPPP